LNEICCFLKSVIFGNLLFLETFLNNLGLNKLQQKAKDTHRKIRIEVCRGKRRGKSHATNGDIEALVTRRVLKNMQKSDEIEQKPNETEGDLHLVQ
jgi:hypothetical protein